MTTNAIKPSFSPFSSVLPLGTTSSSLLLSKRRADFAPIVPEAILPRATACSRGHVDRLPVSAGRMVLSAIFLFAGTLQRHASQSACCAAAQRIVGFTKRSLAVERARAERVLLTA